MQSALAGAHGELVFNFGLLIYDRILYFLVSKSVARRIKIASVAAFIVVIFTFGYYGKIKETVRIKKINFFLQK